MTINLFAEIVFFENAKDWFRFPFDNSIRVSFRLKGHEESTPSELIFSERVDITGKKYKGHIKVLGRDFLEGKIHPGVEFQIGPFPQVIGEGTVLAMTS